MNKAELLKKLTESGKIKANQKKKEELKKENKKEEEIFLQARKCGLEFYKGALKKMKKIAENEGKNEHTINIGSFNGREPSKEDSVWFGSVTAYLVEKFRKDGLEAKSEWAYSPRCGSDDDFGNQTYVTVTVKW